MQRWRLVVVCSIFSFSYLAVMLVSRITTDFNRFPVMEGRLLMPLFAPLLLLTVLVVWRFRRWALVLVGIAALSACTVILTPQGVILTDASFMPPAFSTWGYPTDVLTTPTQEILPTDTPFPTPSPTEWVQNVTGNRYHIRQCPAPTCTHLGWIDAGEWIEADLFAVSDGWVQVFRDDIEVGWVSGAAFGEYHG